MIRQDDNGERTADPAKPGEQGRWSLCPDNAKRKYYNLHFVRMPITVKAQGERAGHDRQGWLDLCASRGGSGVRKNNDLKYPLVFRANVYDCVDWLHQRMGG